MKIGVGCAKIQKKENNVIFGFREYKGKFHDINIFKRFFLSKNSNKLLKAGKNSCFTN